MASPSARFTVDGTPSSNRGYDVPDILTPVALQLESSHADITKVQFSLVRASKAMGGDTPSFDNGGLAAPVTDPVNVTFVDVSAACAYEIQCQVNDGQDASGKSIDAYTFRRIVVVRSPILKLRPYLITERGEYDPTFGNASAFEEVIDTLDHVSDPETDSFSTGTPAPSAPSVHAAHKIIYLSGTVSAVTVPDASGWVGKRMTFKKKNIAGAVPLNRAGSDTIDGATSFSLTGAYGFVTLRAVAADEILTMPC